MPKFEVPIIGIQLEGRKLTFDKDAPHGAGGALPYSIPNRCVLIPPDTVSYWTPGPGSMTLAGVYVGGRGEAAVRRLLGGSREPVMLRDTLLVALARQMLNLAADKRPGVDDYGTRAWWTTWWRTWNGLSQAPPPKRPVRNTTYDSAMSEILSLIENNIEQPLTIELLAAKAGMSPALFRKRFTDTYRDAGAQLCVEGAHRARLRADRRVQPSAGGHRRPVRLLQPEPHDPHLPPRAGRHSGGAAACRNGCGPSRAESAVQSLNLSPNRGAFAVRYGVKAAAPGWRDGMFVGTDDRPRRAV